eukprot:m.218184 g.218184  ORF g.218184 m.218184 type:complete len:448 (-) comp17216_c0_seq4:2019-3362(-)
MEPQPFSKKPKRDSRSPSRSPLPTIDLSTWDNLITASSATMLRCRLPTPPPMRMDVMLTPLPATPTPSTPVGSITASESTQFCFLKPPSMGPKAEASASLVPDLSAPSWHTHILQRALTTTRTTTASQTTALASTRVPSASLTCLAHPFSHPDGPNLPDLELHLHANTQEAQQSLVEAVIHSSASVVVIRDFTSATDLNIRLFDPRRLARRSPEHSIDIRKHRVSLATPERHRSSQGEDEWVFPSQPDTSTLRSYVDYMERWVAEPDESQTVEVSFGTNLDLDDPQVWQAQLQELKHRIPEALRWDSKDGLLSRLGYTIAGMSGVQLYLKVFGCRTPAHQVASTGKATIHLHVDQHLFVSTSLSLSAPPCQHLFVSTSLSASLSAPLYQHLFVSVNLFFFALSLTQLLWAILGEQLPCLRQPQHRPRSCSVVDCPSVPRSHPSQTLC